MKFSNLGFFIGVSSAIFGLLFLFEIFSGIDLPFNIFGIEFYLFNFTLSGVIVYVIDYLKDKSGK